MGPGGPQSQKNHSRVGRITCAIGQSDHGACPDSRGGGTDSAHCLREDGTITVQKSTRMRCHQTVFRKMWNVMQARWLLGSSVSIPAHPGHGCSARPSPTPRSLISHGELETAMVGM